MTETHSNLSGPLTQILDREESVIYALNRQLQIVYCNPAWDRFALENQGSVAESHQVRNRSVLSAISEPLKSFYENAFRNVYETGKPWESSYECSTPTQYRLFRMQVLPVEDNYLLVINSIEAQYPHGSERPVRSPSPSLYLSPEGFIAMCSNCRRTRRMDTPESWDWVPEYVSTKPGNITHSLCPICVYHFFPEYA